MNIYLLEKASANYYKQKGDWRYPVEAFKQGNVFENCTDTEVVKVLGTKREALKELECYPTSYNELSGGGRDYLQVVEYRVYECEFDISEALEEKGFGTNVDECLKALKSNANDFWDYIDYSGWSWGDSIGTLNAWVKVEKKENGRTSTDYIEKEFTNDEDFNAYEMAEEWSNNKFDEIQAKEDEGVLFAVDCGVSY